MELASPPASPGPSQRPMSAMIRPPRSASRMSTGSKPGGSRASDEDARTSVKVAVRVRPPLQPSDPGYDLIPQRFQRATVQVTSPTNVAVESPQGKKLFVFDRVFGESVDQGGIWDYLHESVDSFTQGYNVSILAYGQSGAGKSFTMGTAGPSEQSNSNTIGIIPRAAQSLFEKLSGPSHARNGSTGIQKPQRYSVNSLHALQHSFHKNSTEKNWTLTATYVEIYNEQLRDLLLPEATPLSERSNVMIREDRGKIILTGSHQVTINSFEDLMGALSFGSSIRQTDATAINATSSRSHAIFSLNLVQRKAGAPQLTAKEKRMSVPVESMSGSDNTVTLDSKLHFIDLAGSERLKNTGAIGDRAREGININAGLASLAKVISQLSSRNAGAHVSYRDSKLTRLLQDSLGGNAITYMIACVNPAEFHLSETLNTIQYAQRARAIQSKPRIQQVTDDSDKQAVIDRLRAEVQFLRQQIRSSEGSERRTNGTTERSERHNDREIELQNSLLDAQESYTALSQRHAKLISELSKASEADQDALNTGNAGVESAVERLKRSSSFAETVEQVVLEYEKTIQSLESSLTKTRTSLSESESSLLERETRCAFVETMNTQLSARLTKMMDRENSTENYLRDLEAKLDNHTNGEEKSSAIVTELKKEIARARENEASCEDYISRLEERMAESDQDMEMMQREIDRLEHVVERQRSLGKLDNLLLELDHANGVANGHSGEETPQKKATNSHLRTPTLDTLKEASEVAIPEGDDGLAENAPDTDAEQADVTKDDGLEEVQKTIPGLTQETTLEAPLNTEEFPPQSPAQSKFVADKLETTNQELFDLRMEHEQLFGEHEILSAKYEEALRTLAELQDAVDEARHPAATPTVTSPTHSRPVSFLGDARINELKSGGHSLSSRSLSSELSLAGEAPPSEATDATDVTITPASQSGDDREVEEDSHHSTNQVGELQNLLKEHQSNLELITQQYEQLQAEHEETLDVVEELRTEVSKARSLPPPSPTQLQPVIRRMTSQGVMTVDRAHRSLASLRNIAVEEFENRPETMSAFEVNLNTAMHELHSRVERIHALEAENLSVKREMEMKSTIISGLTRERSSLQGASPIDRGVVNRMQEQLAQSENQIHMLQESHAAKVGELMTEIKLLQESLNTRREDATEQGDTEQHDLIMKLQTDLSQWEGKHQATNESLTATESKLSATLVELESALASLEALRSQNVAATTASEEGGASAAKALEEEKARHTEAISGLQREIDDHRSQVASHVQKIAELEGSHSATRSELEQLSEHRQTLESEAQGHKARVTELEGLIVEYKAAKDSSNYDLDTLRGTHAKEIEDLKTSLVATETDKHAQLTEQAEQHERAITALKSSLESNQAELQTLLQSVGLSLQSETSASQLPEQIKSLLAEKNETHEKYTALAAANEELKQQLEDKVGGHAELEKQAADLTGQVAQRDELTQKLAETVALHEEDIRKKEALLKKKDATLKEAVAEKDKSARLVEELEEQITSSFDQHHNRLSTIQQERTHALEEAHIKISVLEKELEGSRSRIETLELQSRRASGQVDPMERTGSLTNNLRKSSSHTSLPSPPPAIPLPPIPSMSNGNTTSPPASRHASKELVSAQLVEDQEARIRTIEKHLHAEKQLTATLEEALMDLETQTNKVKTDMETWKKKAWAYEDELTTLRKERNSTRMSIQAVEEERSARREAEAARAHLEERMNALSKKKKKSGLNCF